MFARAATSVLSRNVSRRFSSTRNFKILGIQQIAIGALDKAPLTNFWVDLLGINKVGTYRAEKENVDEDILSLGKGTNAVEIDLMMPIDPNKVSLFDLDICCCTIAIILFY